MNVLVVDDDVVSRMVLMHLIDGLGGYQVAEAEDGLQAWEQLRAGLRPTVCFCDMRMPRLSGLDLLQKVKAEPGMSAIQFVMVSSANEVDVVQAATSQGAAGYITKPFHGEQVRSHLARLAPSHTSVGVHADAASEPPRETMKRLGINAERLLAYLGGFDKQVDAVSAELPVLLAHTGDDAQHRVERLLAGCQTLGLHGAAAALGALGATSHPLQVQQALALTASAVAAQTIAARCLQGASAGR